MYNNSYGTFHLQSVTWSPFFNLVRHSVKELIYDPASVTLGMSLSCLYLAHYWSNDFKLWQLRLEKHCYLETLPAPHKDSFLKDIITLKMKKDKHFSHVQFCYSPKLVKDINNNCWRQIMFSRTGDKCLIGETVLDSKLQPGLEEITELVLFCS